MTHRYDGKPLTPDALLLLIELLRWAMKGHPTIAVYDMSRLGSMNELCWQGLARSYGPYQEEPTAPLQINMTLVTEVPEYIYMGDRLTCYQHKDKLCAAVRRPDGKCIRGKNGNMLVQFYNDGTTAVVLGRRLRRLDRLRKDDGK